MCVYSAVFDHYTPQFDRWVKPAVPLVPLTPAPAAPSDFDWQTFFDAKGTVEELKKLIQEFKEAAKHAKKLDELMAKPDCEDPDKAKLLDRIKELEKQISQLQKSKKTKKK